MRSRALIVTLVLALSLGAFLAPAEAQKKKRKKKKHSPPVSVELQYFFRSDGCAEDQHAYVLSLTDGDDVSCFYTRSGFIYEGQIRAGDDSRTLGQTFVAAEGLPFVLDTSKPLTGEITTRNWNGAGIGQPTVSITVVGTVGGEERELGTHSETFTAVPTQQHTTALELEIDPELAGVEFDGFSVHVVTHGFSAGHGVIEMNEPPTFVVVPTLQRAK